MVQYIGSFEGSKAGLMGLMASRELACCPLRIRTAQAYSSNGRNVAEADDVLVNQKEAGNLKETRLTFNTL
jgi:hypothetical protein